MHIAKMIFAKSNYPARLHSQVHIPMHKRAFGCIIRYNAPKKQPGPHPVFHEKQAHWSPEILSAPRPTHPTRQHAS